MGGASSQTCKTDTRIENCRCESYKSMATYRGRHEGIKPNSALERYFSGASSLGICYKACDVCITDEAKKYLTYHPNGWRVGTGDPKFTDTYGWEDYEEIVVK